MEFIEYSKCSTCKKAKKYLVDNNIEFIDREIKTKTPTKEELRSWINNYNIDIKKFFNTSGLIYRDMKLKDKLNSLSIDEKIDLLASNAMLIKRPILVNSDNVLVGFKEEEWSTYLK